MIFASTVDECVNEGYVTVKLVPPATTETLQDNPLGIVVASLNWTQVGQTWSTGLGASEPGPPGATSGGGGPGGPGADTTLHRGANP